MSETRLKKLASRELLEQGTARGDRRVHSVTVGWLEMRKQIRSTHGQLSWTSRAPPFAV
jgi:hypothetical protein